MSLQNLIKSKLVTATAEQSVTEVAELMKEHEIGSVIVVDEYGAPEGIITDRDIVLRCVVNKTDCENVHARNIMSRSVKTVNESDGLMDVIRCMSDERVRRIPVVDDSGRAVGLVSFGDLLELLATELAHLAVPATPEDKKISAA